MNRDSLAHPRRLPDGGRQFDLGVLVRGDEPLVTNRIGPGFINLDEIRTLFKLLTNHLDQLGDAVGIGSVRKHMLGWIVVNGIFVAAENVYGIPADAQPRTGNSSLIDG